MRDKLVWRQLTDLFSRGYSIKRMRIMFVVVDALIFNACILIALWLRFDGTIRAEYWELYLATAAWATCILVVVSYSFGLYNRIWEYASVDAVLTIFGSMTVTIVLMVVIMIAGHDARYPRSVLAMSWGFALLGVGGSRFGWRAVRSTLALGDRHSKGKRRRLAIYGAGHAGVLLARQAEQDPGGAYEVVGFIDDDPRLKGMFAGGSRVLGTSEELAEIVQRYDVEEIIAAMPCVDGDKLEELLEQSRELELTVRTLPRLLETLNGEASLEAAREVDVSDLLGRNPECPHLDLPRDYISGLTVMVTGAGGSIGSEICRQLCRYHPERVVLLGRGENRIHSIFYELRDKFTEITFEPLICNITSESAVEAVLRCYRPEVIFHAAAHKHVFLMEYNPVEAVWNNIIGTGIVADLAERYGVERLVMISTDKATEPTSVMGATKAFCERLIANKARASTGTKFMTVRFGNVLGSAGSVVPIFQALAQADKPLTVTDAEADRFFMTIEEASFLVLQAGALGNGGEVFVLDMGDPIKIVDIARAILRLHGKDPDAPGAIEIIGLRQGEKLHETLINSYEELEATEIPQIRKVVLNSDVPRYMEVEEGLESIRESACEYDEVRVLEILARATHARLDEKTQE